MKLQVCISVLVALAVAGQAKQITVTIDTRPLLNTPAGLDLAFSDGGLTGDGNNAVIVSGFQFGGGSAQSGPQPSFCDGSAAGDLSSGIVFSDLGFMSQCFVSFIAGDTLTFTISYTNNTEPGVVDEFALLVTNEFTGMVPTSGGYALLQIDFDSANPTIQTFASTGPYGVNAPVVTGGSLPPAPVLVSPANGAMGVTATPTFTWNAASGATSYDVYIGAPSNPVFATNTTATSYSPGALSLGSTYAWFVAARNASGVASSATSTFTTVSGPMPTSVSPGAGSGMSQTMTFTFTDGSGWQNFMVLDVLINNAIDGRQACYVAFLPTASGTGSVLLVDNAGDAGGPFSSLTLPGTGTAQNSQCTINGNGSSAEMSGNTLTLTLSYTFNASFGGNKVIYTAARDASGNNSGWLALGTWGVPSIPPTGPSVGGVNPARSSATSQTYTFTFNDTNGWQDITVADILINSAIDGRHACYIAFVPSGATSGTALLVDDFGDAGGPFATVSLPGSASGQNTQCIVNGTGSSVTGGGNTLTLTLSLGFNPSFAGNQVFYLAARSNTANSNWQAAGSVSVP